MVLEINRHPDRPRADPREREEWFQRLDPNAQDVVRQRWVEEELDWERLGRLQGRDLRHDLLSGALLLGSIHAAVVLVLGGMLTPFTGGTGFLNMVLHVALASAVGAGLGAFWRAVEAGLLICTLTGSLMVIGFELAVGMHWFFAMCAGVMGGHLGKWIGLRRIELPGC